MGSAPGNLGSFTGRDFRQAYAPTTTLTGSGQRVGIYNPHFAYDPNDIVTYWNNTNQATALGSLPLPSVKVRTVVAQGDAAVFSHDSRSGEVTLDIEMAIAMAPGLDEVIVYEGEDALTIFNRMATDNVARQLSTSWVPVPTGAGADQVYDQMAAQGQTLFAAAGDDGAYYSTVPLWVDNPRITVVGGTDLTTDANHAWSSEVVWKETGGGQSADYLGNYGIPTWQQGINMSANKGSTTMRNVPDVALPATNVYYFFDGVGENTGGTSAAAPLWAGYMALINQQAAALGKKPVGFSNPAIYALGKSLEHASYFHDITSGDNLTPWNMRPNHAQEYFAVPGFDLCTGWGTPVGMDTIYGLALYGSQGQFTDAAPAVVGVGNSVYFFAKTRDGRVVYNRAVFGQAGVGWKEVEGGGRTDFAPAAGAVGTHVFVAIRGADGHVQINQADEGQPFGAWFNADVTTDVSPAATGVGNTVYFFAKSTDGRILYRRAVLGQAGTPWKEMEGHGQTDQAPAAAAVGNHLFVAIRAMNGHVEINQADLNGAFGDWFVADRLTNSAPAAAGVGDMVYFFATAADGRVFYDRAVVGQSGVGWQEVEGGMRTNAGPGAGAVGNHVFVAVRAQTGLVSVNQADRGQPFGVWH